MTSRKPPRKRNPMRDTSGFVPPSDAVEFSPPSDAVEIGGSVAPVESPEIASQKNENAPSWIEAAFPRTSAAMERGEPWYSPRVGVSSIIDQASLPGRALSTVLSGPESSNIARTELARTGGDGMLDQIVRDPATGALAVMPVAAPARLGWLGRGALTGAEVGAGSGATRQGERYSSGTPISAAEFAGDVGLGASLGIGGALAGAGARKVGQWSVPAAMKLAKVDRKYREGVESVLPEMMRRGLYAPSVKGIESRASAMEEALGERYRAASAPYAGVPAVPLSMYGARAAGGVERRAASGELGPEDEMAVAEWIMRRASRPEAAGVGPGMVDVPTAVSVRSKTRKAAGSYESQAPTSARREAMQDAADELAASINERLGIVAPEIRAIDREAAPFYQYRPYVEALGRRKSNYEIGLTELGAFGGAGALGLSGSPTAGIGAGIAAAALARAQRSPALPWAMYQTGRAGEAALRSPAIISRLGIGLMPANTDNARGR